MTLLGGIFSSVTVFSFLFSFAFRFSSFHWRRKWPPTPVFLPGESYRRRSLVVYSPQVTKSRTRLSDFTFTFSFFHSYL